MAQSSAQQKKSQQNESQKTESQKPSAEDTKQQVSEQTQQWAQSAASASSEAAEHYVTEPARDLLDLAKSYLKEKPDVAAMWCFGLGVIVGWKLKP